MDHVGTQVKQLRTERGWTQPELAVSAGIAVSGLSQIENGKRNASSATVTKLATALGVEVAELFPKAPAPLPELTVGMGHSGEIRINDHAVEVGEWLAAWDANAVLYEMVLENGDLEQIQKVVDAVAELYLAYQGATRRRLRHIASTEQKEDLAAAEAKVKRIRKKAREVASAKLEEEREQLDPGKIVQLEKRQAELGERIAREDEADAS